MKIRYVSRKVNTTFVAPLDPNAQSLVNSCQLSHLLTERKVAIPQNLIQKFPDLAPIAEES